MVMLLNVPPYVLPSPARILATVEEQAGPLVGASLWTAWAAFCGFSASLLIGTLIAFAFSQSDIIRRSMYPYAIFLQTVPIVAIAPLIIIWFGTGFPSIVFVSFIISLFPIITNATSGLTSVDSNLLDLFTLHHATRRQILLKLRLPNAVPHLVTGARISSGLSVIGAIVGEFFAGYGSAQHGLGYLIVLTSGQLKTAYLFACIGASTALGLIIFTSVGLVGDAILSRWQETRR
ncbi:MAG: ABC transporter permease [Lentisphaerae bacterium]|nr:ABC transporter permease [Lentisphaerota bacterium]